MKRYAPDLMKDKVQVFFNKYYYVVPIIAGVILFAIGGWSMVLWGIFLRQVIGWHSTWLVNSATHLWGTRRFETRDDSRNNGLIAALTFGEGWHNNHHAHPRSAKHGLTWYEFDVNWVQIKAAGKIRIGAEMFTLTNGKRKSKRKISQSEPLQRSGLEKAKVKGKKAKVRNDF